VSAPYPLCVGMFVGQERFFAQVLVFGAFASLASRSAVRFFAAASDAFLARAERSSGVMFVAAVLPPSLPNLRATSVIAARTSAEILTLISSMVHLRLYGGNIDILGGKVYSESGSDVRFAKGIEH
jgi:hypothetical protein